MSHLAGPEDAPVVSSAPVVAAIRVCLQHVQALLDPPIDLAMNSAPAEDFRLAVQELQGLLEQLGNKQIRKESAADRKDQADGKIAAAATMIRRLVVPAASRLFTVDDVEGGDTELLRDALKRVEACIVTWEEKQSK